MRKQNFTSSVRSRSKKIAGHKARDFGGLFEKMLQNRCVLSNVAFVKIPDGCIMIRSKYGVIPKRVKTPFDFVIADNGKAVFLDCKTLESGNFSHSMLKEHQVESLKMLQKKDCVAGYLIWFRDADAVCFFEAFRLATLRPRESIGPDDGVLLGTSQSFNLGRLIA